MMNWVGENADPALKPPLAPQAWLNRTTLSAFLGHETDIGARDVGSCRLLGAVL